MAYFSYNNKKVYYEVIGEGQPLLLLHGNSVSSKMFGGVLELYSEGYQLILIDFLGHGRSDRLDTFTTDFWYDQALQVIGLCESLNLKDVNLIGTSGGALAAINVALERPDLVGKVIADSFEGERSIDEFAGDVIEDRRQSKLDEGAIQFWTYMHGDDWSVVVDLDTDVVVRHHQEIGNFFHTDLSDLQVPTFLVGTKEDEFCSTIEESYQEMHRKIKHSLVHLFDKGGHPSMMTSAEAFARLAKEFL